MNLSVVGSSCSSQELDRPVCSVTISVIGFSGPDAVNGAHGVGKSALCNRLVCPHYEQFSLNHGSLLSQSDFSGSQVINNDHWLYWGESELDADYPGKTTHIRVIEQTEFIDDETFEPLRSSGQMADYVKRASRVNLESRDKLMYICRDQLGDESSYEAHYLPDGKASIDGFLLVYDVSQPIPGQSEMCINLIQAVTKLKKPIFLAATKCDAIKRYTEGMNEMQKLLRRKECKNIIPNIVETSAKDNVNINGLLKFIATNLEKHKLKSKLLTYPEAHELQMLRMKEANDNFISLIGQLLPREEWPTRQNQLNWRTLVNDFGFAYQPAYTKFVSYFGAKEAEKIYDLHIRKSQDWWTQKELREKLPALRNVLLEFFDANALIEAKWEDVVYDTEQHPMFDRYFKPVGQSLNRYIHHTQDARIPAELLQIYDAQHMFQDLQKEIENKAVLDAQTERFISFLAHKDVITPGRKYVDAKVLVSEIQTFEHFLPDGRAEQAYLDFQSLLINDAEREFLELLQEKLPLFATYALMKREHKNYNNNEMDRELESYFVEALQEDRRFRHLSGLPDRRRKILQRFANFIVNPLDDFCPAGSFCANRQISKIIESNKTNYHRYTPVDIVVCGEDYLVDEFITAVNMSLSMEKLFDYDAGLAKITCFKAMDVFTSSRVRSLVCVVDSSEALEKLLSQKWTSSPSLPPLFINAFSESGRNLHKKVSQVADKIGGVYISDENLIESDIGSIQSLTGHFHLDQIQRVLREVCHTQLSGSYSDLRIQMSFMCGDVFKPDAVISMLLDQANHSTSSGNVFTLDQHLPEENINVRIRIDASAYHSWLLSPSGWPMNSINGHVLIYSPLRVASWHNCEMAARMLIEAAGSNHDERVAVAKSILILAIDDPTNYFNNKNSRILLTLGSKLAQELGASFSTYSPASTGTSQMELFVNYFEQVFNNDPLPDTFYFPMVISSKLFNYSINGGSCSSSDDGRVGARTGEYTTLKSTGSAASHESNDSGASANSVNGTFFGPVRSSIPKSTVPSIQIRSHSTTASNSQDFKLSGSPHSNSSGNAANNSRKQLSGFISRLSTRSNNSASSNETSPVAPLARPEFDATNEFYYESAHDDPCYASVDVTKISGPSTSSGSTLSNQLVPNAATMTSVVITPQKSQRKIDKFFPKIGRLILDNSPSSQIPPTSITLDPGTLTETPPTGGVVQMFVNGSPYVQAHTNDNVTTINIPTMDRPSARSVDDQAAPQIKFRVNGTERNVDDHGNVTTRPAGRRLSHLLRSHSDESIFLDVDSPQDEQPESPPPVFVRNTRVIRRQGSLREGSKHRNRSYSRSKRSFFTAANEKSSNFANKFVASFRLKNKDRSNTVVHNVDDGVEIVGVSRLDSFGNPASRNPPSTSVPPSPNMAKKSGLSKTTSAVSTAFSWFPNRSQKRSQRAKSEGVDQLSSSPSPVDTLQSLCEAVNSTDGVPIFASKCITFIERNGGLETEGLYRVPGNQSQVMELEKQFKANPDVKLESLNLPIHVVATAIKKFFDTLPEPIIPNILHFGILEIIASLNELSPSIRSKSSLGSPCSYTTAPESMDECPVRQQHIERLTKFLRQHLPPVNRRVLYYLAAHLKRVSDSSEKTSMDVRNLSKIFGPTLFRPEFDTFDEMASHMAKFELAMYLILENCHDMLGPITN